MAYFLVCAAIVVVCAIIGIDLTEVWHTIKVLFANSPIGCCITPLVILLVIGAVLGK